jgi:hypothetical protein
MIIMNQKNQSCAAKNRSMTPVQSFIVLNHFLMLILSFFKYWLTFTTLKWIEKKNHAGISRGKKGQLVLTSFNDVKIGAGCRTWDNFVCNPLCWIPTRAVRGRAARSKQELIARAPRTLCTRAAIFQSARIPQPTMHRRRSRQKQRISS